MYPPLAATLSTQAVTRTDHTLYIVIGGRRVKTKRNHTSESTSISIYLCIYASGTHFEKGGGAESQSLICRCPDQMTWVRHNPNFTHGQGQGRYPALLTRAVLVQCVQLGCCKAELWYIGVRCDRRRSSKIGDISDRGVRAYKSDTHAQSLRHKRPNSPSTAPPGDRTRTRTSSPSRSTCGGKPRQPPPLQHTASCFSPSAQGRRRS